MEKTPRREDDIATDLHAVVHVLFQPLLCKVRECPSHGQMETEKASHFAVVSSLRTLNAALSKYRETYGEYPANLKQLGPSSRVAAPSSDHAALVTDPFEAESYFILTYQVAWMESGKRTGYEIQVTPRSPEYSHLSHYFTDQTGLICSDSRSATGKSLVITEDLHPTVTIR